MSAPITKNLLLLGLGAGAVLCLALAVPMRAWAVSDTQTKPYFKVTGGDVSTGGWFYGDDDTCDTSTTGNYQDSNFSSVAYPADAEHRYGGILSFAKTNAAKDSAGGSSSEFAAYSLGEIDGTEAGDASNYGFYSAGAQAAASSGNTARNYLSFANIVTPTPANFWSGLLVPPGGVRQTAYCIPDYYDSKIPSPLPGPLPGNRLNDSPLTPNGNYFKTAASTPFELVGNDSTGSDVGLPAGTHITVFVKGSVYISHNITYGNYTADSVPKFALVVKGTIYIGPNVTRLDGLYIAQPDDSGSATALSDDSGDIWTCHLDNTEQISYIYPANPCTNRLVVDGAFIAKQINLMRAAGDVGSASYTEDGFANALSSQAAEVINYSPAMVMGGSFFSDNSGNQIDSLISLPPVF